jgi:hypothetical protein
MDKGENGKKSVEQHPRSGGEVSAPLHSNNVSQQVLGGKDDKKEVGIS